MKQAVCLALALVVVAGIAALVSCYGGSSDKKRCPVGSEGCPCLSGDCNGDLVCEAGKCVSPSTDTDTDTKTDTDGGTAPPTPSRSSIDYVNDGTGKICASGTVVGPHDGIGWDRLWGAGFGLNFCQTESNGDKIPLGECPTDMSRLRGFRLTVTGTMPSELRIQFEDNFEGTDEIAGDNGYIVAQGLDVPADYMFEDAEVFYIPENGRPELRPELFTGLQFQIATQQGVVEPYEFCIEGIEVILAEEDIDGGVVDTDSDIDAGTESDCDDSSLAIIPDINGWVDGCSNAAGIQGDLYRYSDPG